MDLDVEAVRRAADRIATLGDAVGEVVLVAGNASGPLGTADFCSNVASLGSVGAKYRDVFDEFAASADVLSPTIQRALNKMEKSVKVFSDDLHSFVTNVKITDESAAEQLRAGWTDW